MRLDVLRDIMVELVAALPPDRAAGFAAALGNRLNGRIYDMEIDERSDVSDGVNPRLFDGEDAVFGFAGVQR